MSIVYDHRDAGRTRVRRLLAALSTAGLGVALSLALGLALSLGLLAGCASPGPPHAPTLNLPESVSDLSAERVGDQVRLSWTTPARTTDKLPIKGPMVAEICREAISATTLDAARKASVTPCSPTLLKMPVTPGAAQAVDKLPAALTTGPLELLGYRVQLINADGRTAGASAEALALTGAAPPAVEQMRARAGKTGVVIEWSPLPTEDGRALTLELSRAELGRAKIDYAPAAVASAATSIAPPDKKISPAHSSRPPAESLLRVAVDGEATGGANVHDPGGAIDRTAMLGQSYRYRAERVFRINFGGYTLTKRSLPSDDVTVVVPSDFAPDRPQSLVAAPGYADQASAIDLSWEPNLEAKIAGYHIERRDLDGGDPEAWHRLDQTPTHQCAYRDAAVAAGHRYAYRVTAVNQAGQESAPSTPVVESAPASQIDPTP